MTPRGSAVSKAIALMLVAACLSVAGCVTSEKGISSTWSPSESQLTRAAELDSPEALKTFLGESWKEGALTGAQIDVLRAGLRLPNGPAAIHCACRLEPLWLDAWESRRLVQLLLPRAFSPGSSVDFERLRFTMGSVDVPQLFDVIPPHEAWSPDVFLGKIHVIMRPHHFREAEAALLSTDPRIRELGEELLWVTLGYDDGDRISISDLLIRYFRLEPVGDATGGIHPNLAALLSQMLLRGEAGAAVCPRELRSKLEGWLLRWLGDSVPTRADVPLVMNLAAIGRDSEGSRGQSLLMAVDRACSKLDDAQTHSYLTGRKHLLSADAALVKRGDSAALRRLLDQSLSSGSAFGYLLEVAPKKAGEILATVYGLPWKDRLAFIDGAQSLATAYFNEGLRWPAAADELMSDVLAEKCRDAPYLTLLLAATLPGCSRPSIISSSLETLRDSAESEEESLAELLALEELPSITGIGDRVRFLASFLDADLYREVIHGWVRSANQSVRQFGLAQQLLVGDEKAGSELLAYANECDTHDGVWPVLMSGPPESDRVSVFLARSRSPVILAHLMSSSSPGRLVLSGLPQTLAVRAWEYLDDEEEKLLASGELDGVTLLVRILNRCDEPGEVIRSFPLGLVDDSRVAAWLRRVRDRRELECWAMATGHLAVMGDAEARREIREVIEDGRYGQLYELDEHVLTENYRLSSLAYEISELRSQCCRISMGNANVDELLPGENSFWSGASGVKHTPWSVAARFYLPREGRRLIWDDVSEELQVIDG